MTTNSSPKNTHGQSTDTLASMTQLLQQRQEEIKQLRQDLKTALAAYRELLRRQ